LWHRLHADHLSALQLLRDHTVLWGVCLLHSPPPCCSHRCLPLCSAIKEILHRNTTGNVCMLSACSVVALPPPPLHSHLHRHPKGGGLTVGFRGYGPLPPFCAWLGRFRLSPILCFPYPPFVHHHACQLFPLFSAVRGGLVVGFSDDFNFPPVRFRSSPPFRCF